MWHEFLDKADVFIETDTYMNFKGCLFLLLGLMIVLFSIVRQGMVFRIVRVIVYFPLVILIIIFLMVMGAIGSIINGIARICGKV